MLADQRKRKYELRNVLNAIFYVVKGGIPWRLMPNDLTTLANRVLLLYQVSSVGNLARTK
ncbi:transposase [Larkinella punicea]|uniref:transposase n=1 Tax=Larkinella punicea TaxID=2315727 RepID=UPI0035B623EC